MATLIGISRVSDYRHHWQDVFAGALIGLVYALVSYTIYFKSPFKKMFAEESRDYLRHQHFRIPRDPLPEEYEVPSTKTPLASEYSV